MKELIDRISHHVLVNRIRVTEFVSDFDKLRSGLISDSIFERVLKTLRLNLSQKQIFSLSQHYRDSEKPDKIQWRKFIDDVSVIFSTSFQLQRRRVVSVKTIGRKIDFWGNYKIKQKFRPLQSRSTILLNATCPKIQLNIWTWIALGLRPGTLFRPRSKLLMTA